MPLPIDMDIIRKRQEIPEKIAALSYTDPQKAVKYIRLWGERKITISKIHADLSKDLKESEAENAG